MCIQSLCEGPIKWGTVARHRDIGAPTSQTLAHQWSDVAPIVGMAFFCACYLSYLLSPLMAVKCHGDGQIAVLVCGNGCIYSPLPCVTTPCDLLHGKPWPRTVTPCHDPMSRPAHSWCSKKSKDGICCLYSKLLLSFDFEKHPCAADIAINNWISSGLRLYICPYNNQATVIISSTQHLNVTYFQFCPGCVLQFICLHCKMVNIPF